VSALTHRVRRPRLSRPALSPRVETAFLATLATVLALSLPADAGVHTIAAGALVDTVWAATRAVAASLLLFCLSGYALVRFLLPEALRPHAALWVAPVGACSSGIALTVLGFVHVPFAVSLVLVLAGGAGSSVWALRHRGGGSARFDARELGLPAYVATLLACVALIPYFVAGFPTVTGLGSDAHMATGTAEFLRHNPPTAVNPDEPVDQVPLLWRSKQAIYYDLGGAASLSGLETWEALAPVAALMLALAAVGIFLLARGPLGAGPVVATAAMAAAGLDRMVLHTGLNPYFNQTWGYFTLPFAIVLAWTWVRERSSGSAGLLLLFLLLGAFAYPLALPIPLFALAVFLVVDVRERRQRGEPTGLPDPRRLYRGRRSLLWLLPLGFLLAVPLLGVAEKSRDAAKVVFDPNLSLQAWGGDLPGFVPAHQFFALPSHTLWWLALALMGVLAAWCLLHLPRPLGLGLGAVLVAFLLAGAYFRRREFGWYFEFKTLAFVAPLLVTCAAVGASRLRLPGRLRLVGPLLLALLLVSAQASGRQEVTGTATQLTRGIVELREWDRELPRNASVRLDIKPPEQLWAAYMLSRHRVCSQSPLLGTAYPRVEYSQKADYLLYQRKLYQAIGPPVDASGPPLRSNSLYLLYRARRDLGGRDRCSRRMVQSVSTADL
jgi:hypothetical protein